MSIQKIQSEIKTKEANEDEVYELQLRINDLESEILTIKHEHVLEFNQLSSEFQTTLKQAKTEERFAFEARLAAREIDLLQQIEDLNDALSRQASVKSDNLINQQLID